MEGDLEYISGGNVVVTISDSSSKLFVAESLDRIGLFLSLGLVASEELEPVSTGPLGTIGNVIEVDGVVDGVVGGDKEVLSGDVYEVEDVLEGGKYEDEPDDSDFQSSS